MDEYIIIYDGKFSVNAGKFHKFISSVVWGIHKGNTPEEAISNSGIECGFHCRRHVDISNIQCYKLASDASVFKKDEQW